MFEPRPQIKTAAIGPIATSDGLGYSTPHAIDYGKIWRTLWWGRGIIASVTAGGSDSRAPLGC